MLEDKNKTKVLAPSYYNEFRCIADKCNHSCCIDWEIYIDDKTYDKYKKVGSIIKTVNICSDGACFTLNEDGRCPHLNQSGLCNIILSHGEDFLCDICKKHPRFYNEVNGRVEAGLGIVCEEACRLIINDTCPFTINLTEEDYHLNESNGFTYYYDAIPARNNILTTIEKAESFDSLKVLLKSQFAIKSLYTVDGWLNKLITLEMLDKTWEKVLISAKGAKPYCGNYTFDIYYKRLLSYFVYRHVTVADCEENLRARLAFSILSVDIIKHLFETELVETANATFDKAINLLVDFARRYSAEIEYSEENTEELIFEFESTL